MALMFPEITRTWNPYCGCEYSCVYCWAVALAHGRLKNSPRYKNDFKPQLVDKELNRQFRDGFVFVSSMGDLWGPWVQPEHIHRVLKVVRESPNAEFLFLTKNPARYLEFISQMPKNVVLGATVESVTSHWIANGKTGEFVKHVTRAPSPHQRLTAMAILHHMCSLPLMVSIEPIMAFDQGMFLTYLRDIAPAFIYIGYDNHGHHLPEPTLAETQDLIANLWKFTQVREKSLRKAWNEENGG